MGRVFTGADIVVPSIIENGETAFGVGRGLAETVRGDPGRDRTDRTGRRDGLGAGPAFINNHSFNLRVFFLT